jgi:osmotically-inducible protein OsmY
MLTKTRKDGYRPTHSTDLKRTSARADPEIARDVAKAAKVNLLAPDTEIKVVVREGFVTLEGTAEWDFQRRDAESCARNIAGVRGVMNCIKVKSAMSAVW